MKYDISVENRTIGNISTNGDNIVSVITSDNNTAVIQVPPSQTIGVVTVPTGTKGAKGDPATIEVGTTISADTGVPANVVNVGTASNAVLNFTIPRGLTGPQGEPGDNLELRTTDTFIQWKYVDELVWNDLVAIAAITGPQGIDGEAATVAVGNVISVGPESPAQITNTGTALDAVFDFQIPQGLKGDKGDTGPSIELRSNATHLQWRVAGTAIWNDLVPLADITGPQGDKGDTGDPGVVYSTTEPLDTQVIWINPEEIYNFVVLPINFDTPVPPIDGQYLSIQGGQLVWDDAIVDETDPVYTAEGVTKATAQEITGTKTFTSRILSTSSGLLNGYEFTNLPLAGMFVSGGNTELSVVGPSAGTTITMTSANVGITGNVTWTGTLNSGNVPWARLTDIQVSPEDLDVINAPTATKIIPAYSSAAEFEWIEFPPDEVVFSATAPAATDVIWINPTEDAVGLAGYVLRDGDIMTGPLTLSNDPIQFANQAATKAYVDAVASGDTNVSLSVEWGNVQGTLSAQTDLQNALNSKLNLTGGTVTGALSLTVAPTVANSVATKGYVDTYTDPFDSTGGIYPNVSVGGASVANLAFQVDWADITNKNVAALEIDPVFSGSPAGGITSTNITNWNTAFGWGNHATANYLTSVSFDDLNVTLAPTDGQVLSYDLVAGSLKWVNVTLTETDPVFAASPAGGITQLEIDEWNLKEVVFTDTTPAANLQNRAIWVNPDEDSPVPGQFVLRAGDNLTGFLTLHAAPTQTFHAATKGYADTKAPLSHTHTISQVTNLQSSLDAKLNLSGGTLTNFLNLHAAPTQALHAATKGYVDNYTNPFSTTGNYPNVTVGTASVANTYAETDPIYTAEGVTKATAQDITGTKTFTSRILSASSEGANGYEFSNLTNAGLVVDEVANNLILRNLGGGGTGPSIVLNNSAPAITLSSPLTNITGNLELVGSLQSGTVPWARLSNISVSPTNINTITGTGVVPIDGHVLSYDAASQRFNWVPQPETGISGTVSVSQGGTGRTTLTANQVLVGDGTNQVTSVARSGIDSRTTFPTTLPDISATGTRNSTTFLRGDATWAVPPSPLVISSNLTVNVNGAADNPLVSYATLQSAFNDLGKYKINPGVTVTVNIATGHSPATGLVLNGGDWSQFVITSTDPEVTISTSYLPKINNSIDNFFMKFTNCAAPTINAAFNGNNTVDRGTIQVVTETTVSPNVTYERYIDGTSGSPWSPIVNNATSSTVSGFAYDNSSGVISPGKGFKNALGPGLSVVKSSRVVADSTIFERCALRGRYHEVSGATGAQVQSIIVSFGSSLSFNAGTVRYSGRNGLEVGTASICAARGATAFGNDRYGLRATQGGFLDCQGATTDQNGSHGIYSSFGSHVSASNCFARHNNRILGWTRTGTSLIRRTSVASAVGAYLDANNCSIFTIFKNGYVLNTTAGSLTNPADMHVQQGSTLNANDCRLTSGAAPVFGAGNSSGDTAVVIPASGAYSAFHGTIYYN